MDLSLQRDYTQWLEMDNRCFGKPIFGLKRLETDRLDDGGLSFFLFQSFLVLKLLTGATMKRLTCQALGLIFLT